MLTGEAKNHESGILVVPVTQNPSYVLWAASYQPKHSLYFEEKASQ